MPFFKGMSATALVLLLSILSHVSNGKTPTKCNDPWHGCSLDNAKTVQREWRSFYDMLSSEDKLALMEVIWSEMSLVSAEGTQILKTFYLGPLHIYPEEERAAQEARSQIDFLNQQSIIIDHLSSPETLIEHLRHVQAKLKVKRKPDGVVSLPEAGWEQLSILFENTFLRSVGSVIPGFSDAAWRSCYRTLRMVIYDLTPVREVYYATCDVLPSSGSPNQNIQGKIIFEQKVGESSSRIKVDLSGFDTEDDDVLHGFHVHSVGDIGNGCKNAKGHFNPMGRKHGGPTHDERHVGDLGNIREDENGEVHTILTDQQALLLGENGVFGKSIVIHAGTDDLGQGSHPSSQKTGNAGGRLACCVINFDPQLERLPG